MYSSTVPRATCRGHGTRVDVPFSPIGSMYTRLAGRLHYQGPGKYLALQGLQGRIQGRAAAGARPGGSVRRLRCRPHLRAVHPGAPTPRKSRQPSHLLRRPRASTRTGGMRPSAGLAPRHRAAPRPAFQERSEGRPVVGYVGLAGSGRLGWSGPEEGRGVRRRGAGRAEGWGTRWPASGGTGPLIALQLLGMLFSLLTYTSWRR